MAWFRRSKNGLLPQRKRDIPSGLWVKCDRCAEVLYTQELDRNLRVCPKCGYHGKITSDRYIEILCDSGSFAEFDAGMEAQDPLQFQDTKKYTDRLKVMIKKVNLKEAIRTGRARIHDQPVVVGIMDFRFIGGSMGSVVGEKVKRATLTALEDRCPLIIVTASGGARMMEGAISLMQMAKTSAFLAKFAAQGGLYISILTNPSTAGVMASYASLGDVIIAEPDALIGFAGPRVIKQTIGEDLPEGFQRSEFVLEHGFVDVIVPRLELKKTVSSFIRFFHNGAPPQPPSIQYEETVSSHSK